MRETLVRRALRAPRTAEPVLRGSEEAFTLIELMVVLLIIAILLAIAIPTFLGVTSSANDRAAQTNGTNAVKEALAVFQNNNQTFNAGPFSKSAPEFAWSNDSSGSDFPPGALGSGANLASSGTTANAVSYWVGDSATSADGLALVVATYAKGTSTCWFVADLQATPLLAEIGGPGGDTATFMSTSGITTGGTFYAKATNTTDCQASMAIDPYTWGTTWSNPGVNAGIGGGGSTTTAATTTTVGNSPLGPACTGALATAPSSITWSGDSSYLISGSSDVTGPGTVALRMSVGGVLKLNVVPANGGSISGVVSGTTYLAQLFNSSSSCYSAGLTTTAP